MQKIMASMSERVGALVRWMVLAAGMEAMPGTGLRKPDSWRGRMVLVLGVSIEVRIHGSFSFCLYH